MSSITTSCEVTRINERRREVLVEVARARVHMHRVRVHMHRVKVHLNGGAVHVDDASVRMYREIEQLYRGMLKARSTNSVVM